MQQIQKCKKYPKKYKNVKNIPKNIKNDTIFIYIIINMYKQIIQTFEPEDKREDKEWDDNDRLNR